MNVSKALGLILAGWFGVHGSIASSWLRIDHPSSQTLQALQGKGIHYDNFIWVEQSAVAQDDLLNTQVHEYPMPFHHRLGDTWVDLKHNSLTQDPWLTAPVHAQHDLFLVQFAGPIKTEWLQNLQQNDIKLVSPLAPFSWIVWATEEQILAIDGANPVRHWQHFWPAFRVQQSNRHLSGLIYPTMALLVNDALAQEKQNLQALGAVITHEKRLNESVTAINMNLLGDLYLSAARLPGVLTVQQVHLDGGARSEISQQSIVDNYDGSVAVTPGYPTWLANTGLDGNGVTVAVVDGGIFQNHPDLDNVIPCIGIGASCGDSTDSHGTHVAGAIGGTGVNNALDAAGFNRGLGVAPGVQMVEQLYSPLLGVGPGGMVVGGMLSIYNDSQTSGVVLSNNSWGPTTTPQGYDIPTMEIDIISRDANPDVAGNQPVLAVWSIMNGNGDRNVGSCAPSSLGSPDEAKNLFAVGSTRMQNGDATQASDVFDVSSNSAHGPACDGRLVPHIVAPGCSTDAPNNATSYGMKCGTSMASPVISGSISLFWEQYRINHGSDPSPALAKAIFTAVADDLNGQNDADGQVMGHAPDRKQGWGRVNLEKVINPTNPVWMHNQATVFTQSGQSWSQTLEPVNPNDDVRIMLVWTDAVGPGLGGTNPAWVNDLDLSVSNGSTFLGNQFGADGYSATGGTTDGINNMEGVFLSAAQHGGQEFDIGVMAANIAADALNPYIAVTPQQDFALVCYNCQSNQVIVDLIFESGFDDFIDLIFADGFE